MASVRETILEMAVKRQGIPYRLDPPPDGITTLDCSLFIKLTLQDAGVPLPAGVRTAEQIRQGCEPVVWDSVQAGDLVFFEGTYDAAGPAAPDGHIASHVGISLGKGTHKMWDCHASGESGPPGVGLTDISTDYWQPKLFQAGRPPGLPASGESEQPVSQVTFQLTEGGVRLRAQPSTSADIVVEDLGHGAVMTLSDQVVEADGHRWRNVRTVAGLVGWVAAEFLRTPAAADSDELTDEADHAFGFETLWPHIQAAAAKYNADAQIIAAIMKQESGFTNWRVHRDGTGHGLFGFDDNGLLPDFEQWTGKTYGRGASAESIPPTPQLEYCATTIAAYTGTYGSAFKAARVWHRGPNLWEDTRGQQYEDLIRDHIDTLFVNV
jgi:NlpC/P60 family